MSKLPAISVAMGTYNGAKYIREQLQSLAAQTHLPLELIVTDDGSTDETIAIVEEFGTRAPFPVHVSSNPSRMGFGGNFLRAVSMCRGEIVAFCDQDDVWMPEKLALAVVEFEDDDVMLACHRATVTSANLSPSNKKVPSFEGSRKVSRLHGPLLPAYQGFCQLIRRSIFAGADMDARPPSQWNPDWKMDQDVYALFLARMAGTISLIDKPLALYRVHESNAIATVDRVQSAGEKHFVPPSGAQQYADRASLFRQYAAHAIGLAHSNPDPLLRERFQEGSRWWDAESNFWSNRAVIHSQ